MEKKLNIYFGKNENHKEEIEMIEQLCTKENEEFIYLYETEESILQVEKEIEQLKNRNQFFNMTGHVLQRQFLKEIKSKPVMHRLIKFLKMENGDIYDVEELYYYLLNQFYITGPQKREMSITFTNSEKHFYLKGLKDKRDVELYFYKNNEEEMNENDLIAMNISDKVIYKNEKDFILHGMKNLEAYVLDKLNAKKYEKITKSNNGDYELLNKEIKNKFAINKINLVDLQEIKKDLKEKIKEENDFNYIEKSENLLLFYYFLETDEFGKAEQILKSEFKEKNTEERANFYFKTKQFSHAEELFKNIYQENSFKLLTTIYNYVELSIQLGDKNSALRILKPYIKNYKYAKMQYLKIAKSK